MTKYHLNYMMVLMARDGVKKATFKDSRIKPIFEILIRTHALSQILEDTHALYECGMFGKGSGQLLDEAFKATLKELRPHMLHLVEIDPSETYMLTAIGNYHGDIYEQFNEFAVNSKLNKE